MKFLTLVTMLSLSLSTFAASKRTEFDQNDEKVCYEESRKMGCVKGNEAADVACTKANKTKLSKKCAEVLGAQ
ncbi:MAG: hypothetical protein V4598_12355 [Bdellovibrionota bacterium]